jgi:aspartyl aminopeptidase
MAKDETGAERKTAGQLLVEKLFFELKNCWESASEEETAEAFHFAEGYKAFLDRGKTEREFTRESVALLEKNGFLPLERLAEHRLAPGTKVYENIRGKALIAAVLGKAAPEEGFNILGAHVDSPRIDLKPNPLYEEGGFALLDTHYYGGIKKYQWTAIPLAMHGVLFNSRGETIEIRLGEEEEDPVFTITDLLIHLAQDQLQKKGAEVVEGEDLDILAGSRPYRDEKVKEKVKLLLLTLLHERYGVIEQDLAAAEIEFVPAFKARDLGLDRSMIGAYGHDDRSCAYPALRALVELGGRPEPPEKPLVLYLSDKEEIGSAGNTGAQSWGFESFLARLSGGEGGLFRRGLSRSSMLSADVGAAFDPTYAAVFDKKNASHMGKGLVLTKYTGSRGKYGASDANGEFCARVQALLNRRKIPWQFGELGKVDKGGGGTIALHAARLGIEVLDCGVPVLSMHSPFEVISKIDLYTAYQGYLAFLEEA